MCGFVRVLREVSPLLLYLEFRRIATLAPADLEQGQILLASGAVEVEVARLLRIAEFKSVRVTVREVSQLILDAPLEFLQVLCIEFLGCKELFEPPELFLEHLHERRWFNSAALSTIPTLPPGLSHFCYGLTLVKILVLRFDPL